MSYKSSSINPKVGKASSKTLNLCKVELQRVVCAQAHVEPCFEKVRQRVSLEREEERVVAQRAHGDTDLFEVKKVLQRRDLT